MPVFNIFTRIVAILALSRRVRDALTCGMTSVSLIGERQFGRVLRRRGQQKCELSATNAIGQ